jgi:hypothetical protein
MAVNVITGALASNVVLSANQMPDDDALLYLIKPYRSQFFQKLYFSERPSEEVTDATGLFSYFEDQLYPWQDTLTGAGIIGGAPTQANVGLSNPSYWQVGDYLIVESTEEMVQVSSITGGITFAKVDGTNLTATTTGYVKKCGSYVAEDNLPRVAVSTQEVQLSNYLQIHSETVSMTSREQGAKHFTNGRSLEDQIQKKVEEMKQEFERNLMFSTSYGRNTVGASPYTWSKGFLGTIVTNKVLYTAVTEDAFDAFMQGVFDTGGSDTRDFYCGSNLVTAMNKILKDKYQLTAQPVTEYGVKLKRYLTPFGDVGIYWNPRMDGKFVNYGFAVDWENIKMRYMANDDKGSQKFRIEEHVEANGESVSSVKIYADLSIEIPNESKHGIFYK